MDPSELPQRLKAVGKNQSDLAHAIGLDPSSMTKIIKGKRGLKAEELLKIEAFFDNGGDPSAANVEHLAARRGKAPRRIPVYGYAAAGGGEDGLIAFNSGQIIDWLDPAALLTAPGDLIAVRIIGTSQEPRFFQGEIAIAQLGLAPARGKDCLVEFLDGSALVKTYGGSRDGRVFCRQWNPAKEVSFAAGDVKAVHAVIWPR